MAALLADYQLFAHREIFTPMRAGVMRARAGVRDIKVACIVLGEEVRSFTDFWPIGDLPRRWDEYRREAVEMSARMRDHVAQVREAAWAMGHVPACERFPPDRVAA